MSHYVACELPPYLAKRLIGVIHQLRLPPVGKVHIDEAAKVMLDLVELNLDYFFLLSVDRLKLGTFGQTTSRIGIKTAQGGMSMIINKLVHHLSEEQLGILSEILEGFLLMHEKDGF